MNQTPHQHDVTIHIDKKQYKVGEDQLTGAQLRALPSPAIGPELDLWQEVPGGVDVRIADLDLVALKNGMHFFTAPSSINPG